jgi:hypothetical protein
MNFTKNGKNLQAHVAIMQYNHTFMQRLVKLMQRLVKLVHEAFEVHAVPPLALAAPCEGCVGCVRAVPKDAMIWVDAVVMKVST